MGNTAVIGTAFVDLKGFSRDKYDPQGRNLGEIKIVHGGVGRNVAENFANVGMPVSFVGMLEESAIGRDVENRLSRRGVNLDYALRVPENGMGLWLVILDENGDLAGSVSKMPDTSMLESFLLEKGEEMVRDSEAIVLEIDLSERIAERIVDLAEKYQKPIYSIVGNMSVVLARKDLVRRTSCFICNEVEAGKFFGEEAVRTFSALQMKEYLPHAAAKAGISCMVVTMGGEGAVYYDSVSGVSGICPPCPVQVVDTSGAGDAFFSGTVMGLIRGTDLQGAVQYGARLAAETISIQETNCPVLTDFFI